MPTDCSIIMPAYNAGKTIEKSLDSIGLLRQWKFSVEVIIIDDGSADDTAAVVQSYMKRFSEIRLISSPNGGVAKARNIGLNAADGTYIFFMDADDQVNRSVLENMILLASANEADLVIADYETDDGKEVHIPENRLLNRDYITSVIMSRYVKGQNNGLNTLCNKLFRKNVIEQCGLKLDEKRTHGEDWAYCIAYFEKCRSLYAVKDVVYRYILDGTQTFSKYKKNLDYCLIDGLRIHKKLMADYHIVLTESETMNYQSKVASRFVQACRLPGGATDYFVNDPVFKEVCDYMAGLSLAEMHHLNRSGREKIGFWLLGHGWIRAGLRLFKS